MFARPMRGTTTSQVFWGWDNTSTGGVLGVYVNGTLYTGDTLAAGNGYTGVVEVPVTGDISWRIALDGTAYGPTRTLRAFPSRDQGASLALWHCADGDSPGINAMARRQPHLFIGIGDTCYKDTLVNSPYNVADYRTVFQDSIVNRPAITAGLAKCRNVLTYDNHEFVGNGGESVGDAKHDNGYQAFFEYWMNGIPVNRDAGTHSDSLYDTYPHPYFRQSIGDIDYIVMNHISWTTGLRPTNSQMDATQIAWVRAALAESAADDSCNVILLCSPTYMAPRTDWRDIMRDIDNIDKTVILAVGDLHGPFVNYYDIGADGGSGQSDWFQSRGILMVEGGGIESTSNGADGLFPATGGTDEDSGTLLFSDLAQPGATPGRGANFNFMEVESFPSGTGGYKTPHVRVSVNDCWSGRPRWEGRIPYGSREPVSINAVAGFGGGV